MYKLLSVRPAAHVGYFLQRVVCRPQQLPDTFDTALT